MKTKNIFIGILFVLGFISCHQNEIFFQYQKLSAKEWSKDSLLRYEVAVTDTITPFNMYIHVRHTDSYPYQNFWLFINETLPDSAVKKDTIECFLADQYGKWLGTGNSQKEMVILYKKQLHFPRKGNYHYEITHGMRDSVLSGIHDIGLRIEKDN